MKVNTTVLQSLIGTAIKGAGCNSFMPITQMCEIVNNTTSNMLVVRTRDDNNTFSVAYNFECEDEFDVVVDIQSFSKLITKFTSEFIDLTVADNILKVKGNGAYKIPIELDDGEPIVFCTDVSELPDGDGFTIYADDVRDLIKYHKASLPTKSQEKEMDYLNGYYMSDSSNFSTNTIMICNSDRKIFKEPVLFSQKVMNVLSEFEDCIDVTHFDDGHWQFTDDTMCYECYAMASEIEDYPIDALDGIVKNEEDIKYITVPRMDIVNALSRLGLFVSAYDDGGIAVSADENMIAFNTLNKSGLEVIKLTGNTSAFAPTTFRINIELLYSQLKAMTDGVVKIGYGSDRFLILKDETTTRVIALQKG